MVITKRNLVLLCATCLTALFAAQNIFAQATRGLGSKTPPRQFRVLSLGDPTGLMGLYYDLNGESILIYPSDVTLSPLYESPRKNPLVLYRKIAPVPPETEPEKKTVLSIDLGTEAFSLLVLKSGSHKSVTGMVVDDSWEAFAARRVRVLNLSKRKIATQVEGANAEISSGNSHLFKYESNKPRIRIKVASLDEGTWKLRFNNSQAIIPEARVNVVVSDFEPTPGDPNPDGVKVLKMIDPMLPPAL